MSAFDTLKACVQPLKETLSVYPDLWNIFERCFLSTIETTVKETETDTFVITGDIPAMWLRDSTAQVLHYLRFAGSEDVSKMIEGLLSRQADCILKDPYANAFNREENSFKPYNDFPRASDWVWERKYEIDSLCYPMWLAEKYINKTGNTAFLSGRFHEAMKTVLKVFATEQNHENSDYLFIRSDCPPTDTLSHEGKGAPVKVTGMTWCGFRPSDDACKYGYLIPSNLFAVRAMKSVKALSKLLGDEESYKEAERLEKEIAEGVEAYGKVKHPELGEIYAYETDGFGNYVFMDDANVPSLLALPYLEVCEKDDPLYQRTRAFVLSKHNPYYYEGALAKGVGSPHSPAGYIWPIALCVQAMTSTDDKEIASLLKNVLATTGGTGFMHESFDPNKPEDFTRPWFAWANSMLAETILRLHEEGKLEKILKMTKEL